MKLSLIFFLVPFVITILSLFVISTLFSPVFSMGDFRAQYTGAYIVNHKQSKDLYNLELQHKVQKTFLPTIPKQLVLPFYSPPVIALILSPLGGLSFTHAYLLFGFSQLVLLFLTLFIVITSLDSFSTNASLKNGLSRWHVLLIASAFTTIWMSILHGQLSALWMVVAAVAWSLLRQKRDFYAGLALSLFFLKLHLVILPIILFCVIKRWSVVKGIITGLVFIIIISLFMIGFDGATHYSKFLIELSALERTHGVSASHQTSLFGTIAFLVLGSYEITAARLPLITFPIWIILTALFLKYLFKKWYDIPNTPQGIKLKYAQMLTAMLFTSIHTHNYDLSLLLISLVLLIDTKLISDKKLRNLSPFNTRYLLIIVVGGVSITSTLLGLFAPLNIFMYLVLFYLIEKEYDKISKNYSHD